MTTPLTTRAATAMALVMMSLSATAESEEPRSAPRLTLVWADPYGLLRHGFEPMAQEVIRIFSDAGVEVEWQRRLGDGDPDPARVIINLTPSTPEAYGLSQHAMGVTPCPARPGLHPIVHIFFGNVLRTLKLDFVKRYTFKRPYTPTARETMFLAQALARVVAHELVHAVAPRAPHTKTGVMQPLLTRNDLREIHHLQLSDETRSALRTGLLGPVSPSNPN